MELLSPAGNMDQILVGIENGCNALYGGLKQWGARLKCDNLTVCEYNQALKYCHDHNSKFYLTVNNLLLDKEIIDIFELFHSEILEFPDAVICADVGLIDFFHKYFPQIPIHASTQFGAYTIDDVQFLEKLGVSRVILARELSIEEIKKIINSTNVEIEVFVYGSQCISFSGQCIWGGILNKTSGNRGCCNGFCRQIYKCNGQLGEFLYPKDLNAISLINELKQIGVCSIKIEGRYRSINEIAEVVHDFRDAIDGKRFIPQYNGYLNKKVDYQQMFSTVNSRHKLLEIPVQQLSKNDLVVITDKNGIQKLSFKPTDFSTQNLKFLKSLFINNIHYGIKVVIELTVNSIIIKFSSFGGFRLVFNLVPKENSTISIEEMYMYMSKKLEIEVAEFSANFPAKSKIKVDFFELQKIINKVNKKLHSCSIVNSAVSNVNNSKNLVFISSSADDIYKFQKEFFNESIYCITSVQKLIDDLKILKDNNSIIFKLPVLDFYNNVDSLLQILQNRRIMVNTFSQLELANRYHYSEIIGNYTLNLWNSHSIELAKCFGISALVIHPEIAYNYYYSICSKLKIQLYAFKNIHLPVGYTRACLCCEDKGLYHCIHNQVTFVDIVSNQSVMLRCDNEFGYKNLFSSCVFTTGEIVKSDTKLITDCLYCNVLNDTQVYINNS